MALASIAKETTPVADSTAKITQRINAIDTLRGIVMAIMALDHVREFFMQSAAGQDPLNMDTTTPALYFTRWITHFCAPTFVLLSGMSAFISGQRQSTGERSRFLLSRGIWLVFIEVTVISFGLTFDPQFRMILLQVIWAIGICMILMAGLVYLPRPALLTVGLLLVFGHNLLDPVQVKDPGFLQFAWSALHTFGTFTIFKHTTFFLAYPVLPWLGIMALGYYLGCFYKADFVVEPRHRMFILLGVGAIVLFGVMRLLTNYGDAQQFTQQRTGLKEVYDFFNTTKYPPSLHFILMTIGPALLVLVLFEKVSSTFLQPFTTIGRVPFFYYILHIYLIHVLAWLAAFASGFSLKDMPLGSQLATVPPGFSFGLPVVYGVWLLVLICLYPLCVWYARYKERNKHNKLLRYL